MQSCSVAPKRALTSSGDRGTRRGHAAGRRWLLLSGATQWCSVRYDTARCGPLVTPVLAGGGSDPLR
jgi:hypothetical protein